MGYASCTRHPRSLELHQVVLAVPPVTRRRGGRDRALAVGPSPLQLAGAVDEDAPTLPACRPSDLAPRSVDAGLAGFTGTLGQQPRPNGSGFGSSQLARLAGLASSVTTVTAIAFAGLTTRTSTSVSLPVVLLWTLAEFFGRILSI